MKRDDRYVPDERGDGLDRSAPSTPFVFVAAARRRGVEAEAHQAADPASRAEALRRYLSSHPAQLVVSGTSRRAPVPSALVHTINRCPVPVVVVPLG